MNTVISATAALWSPLQGLLHWLAPERTATHRPSASHGLPAPGRVPARTLGLRSRPLRVVHVMEAGQPRAHVGRMVISGRMADVCAELDRLAACEAASS